MAKFEVGLKSDPNPMTIEGDRIATDAMTTYIVDARGTIVFIAPHTELQYVKKVATQ